MTDEAGTGPAPETGPETESEPAPEPDYHLVVIPHRRPVVHLRFATEADLAAAVAKAAAERTYGDAVRAIAFRGEEIPLAVTPVRRVTVGGVEVAVELAPAIPGWLALAPAQDG